MTKAINIENTLAFKDPNVDYISSVSDVQKSRLVWKPQLPDILRSESKPFEVEDQANEIFSHIDEETQKVVQLIFSSINGPLLEFKPTDEKRLSKPLRIGVVLSGGQAAGGHNVICGVYDYIKQRADESILYGFLNGPIGIYTHEFSEITESTINKYRNMGGFDMICSGRHKIHTDEHMKSSMDVCIELDLDGLIIIGGDDSNTNAALLAEYFERNGCKTSVIGCPKTIDGDLRNKYVEASFGFDTATKIYCEEIGNLSNDVLSTKDRYHFVRVMGRNASHIALECAMQCRPNLTFIGEEVLEKNMTLNDLVNDITDMVVARNKKGMNYGIIIIPEGLIEFIPEVKLLISELNDILAESEFLESKLSSKALKTFNSIPARIQSQLLLDRDPHGNVQVGKIATEELLLLATMDKLAEHNITKFIASTHYFGYEGRAALPTNFDSCYCYSLGFVSSMLVEFRKNGYMSVIRGLSKAVREWIPGGCPLVKMMTLERRGGKDTAVIKKFVVDTKMELFKLFEKVRNSYRLSDFYRHTGPIQFEGDCSNVANYTINTPLESELGGGQDRMSEAMMSQFQNMRNNSVFNVNYLFENDLAIQPADGYKGMSQSTTADVLPRLNSLKTNECQELIICSRYEVSDIKVGVVMIGPPATGVHNVLWGMFESLESRGKIYGFENIGSIVNCKWKELEYGEMKVYRNMGGVELLGCTEVHNTAEAKSQISDVIKSVKKMSLNGLVIIGDSKAIEYSVHLAERMLEYEETVDPSFVTCVVAVPASYDNNVNPNLLETSLGFDSASKCCSQLIGNLLTDGASARKYWYFVRLMSTGPSFIVSECALQTHPTYAVISECCSSLDKLAIDIANVVSKRALDKKDFGTVLLSSSVLLEDESFEALVGDINKLLCSTDSDSEVKKQLMAFDEEALIRLSPMSRILWRKLPDVIKYELTKPTVSGRIEINDVSSDVYLAHLVEKELKERKSSGTYKGSFSPVCFYLGHQTRSCCPSDFDCKLGKIQGCMSMQLILGKVTGHVVAVSHLCYDAIAWRLTTIPMTRFATPIDNDDVNVHHGKLTAKDSLFRCLSTHMTEWYSKEYSCNSGPIQFEGELSNLVGKNMYHKEYEYMKVSSSQL